jgi:hypothetical protein
MNERTLRTFMRGYVLGFISAAIVAWLAGCLSTEPETRTISCGTLAFDTTYDDPVPDTFAVAGGKCRRSGDGQARDAARVEIPLNPPNLKGLRVDD